MYVGVLLPSHSAKTEGNFGVVYMQAGEWPVEGTFLDTCTIPMFSLTMLQEQPHISHLHCKELMTWWQLNSKFVSFSTHDDMQSLPCFG